MQSVNSRAEPDDPEIRCFIDESRHQRTMRTSFSTMLFSVNLYLPREVSDNNRQIIIYLHG